MKNIKSRYIDKNGKLIPGWKKELAKSIGYSKELPLGWEEDLARFLKQPSTVAAIEVMATQTRTTGRVVGISLT